WVIALLIEYAAPAAAFWTPHRGRAPSTQWDVSGAHMAERCGLFVIICLGETILVTGVMFAQMSWTVVTMSAFATAFVGTVAIWWVYFHIGHHRASHLIDHGPDPGRTARLWFTYIHIPILAGIILVAASDQFLLTHPTGQASTEAAITLLGGPAVFLLGALWLKRASSGTPPWPHLAGLALLGGAGFAAGGLSALSLGAIASAILILVAVWDRSSRSQVGELPSVGG
ncbi:MAG: low temperature requirement protein A, partial [Pseudomonadota bacterium]